MSIEKTRDESTSDDVDTSLKLSESADDSTDSPINETTTSESDDADEKVESSDSASQTGDSGVETRSATDTTPLDTKVDPAFEKTILALRSFNQLNDVSNQMLKDMGLKTLNLSDANGNPIRGFQLESPPATFQFLPDGTVKTTLSDREITFPPSDGPNGGTATIRYNETSAGGARVEEVPREQAAVPLLTVNTNEAIKGESGRPDRFYSSDQFTSFQLDASGSRIFTGLTNQADGATAMTQFAPNAVGESPLWTRSLTGTGGSEELITKSAAGNLSRIALETSGNGDGPALSEPAARVDFEQFDPALRSTLRELTGADKTFTPLTDEQVNDVKRLIAQLDADRFNVRESASRELAAFGPAVLPHLEDVATEGSPEASSRARAVVRHVLSGESVSLVSNTGSVAVEGGPVPFSAVDQARMDIEVLDAFARNPELQAARREYLNSLGALTEGIPGTDEIGRAGNELTSLDQMRANARLNLAAMQIRNGDTIGATTTLMDAMAANPEVVKSGTFQMAASRSGAHLDANFMAMYREMGGDASGFDKIAELQQAAAGPPKPVDFGDFGFDVQRGGPGVSGQAYEYLTGDENQQAAAMRTIDEQAAQGDVQAQKAQENLPIVDLVNRNLRNLNSWPPVSQHMTPDQRLALIQDHMKVPPYQREGTHHETIALMLDHYRFSTSDVERKQALDFLRQDVQNGNLSAQQALKSLATVDAAFRLSDASRTLESPVATEAERQAAEQKKQDALMDLARQEYAERKNNEPGNASGLMEHLARRPAMGVNPREVEQARKAVEEEARQSEQKMVETARRATAGGADGEAAMGELRRLAGDQMSGQVTTQFSDMAKRATLAGVAHDALATLDDRQGLSDNLARLGKLAEGDPNARGLITGIGRLGPDGARMEQAILNGDRATIQELAGNPEIKDYLQKHLKPIDDWAQKLKGLRPDDVLTALKEPEKLDELLEIARQEDQEKQVKVDGLVSDYLLRDSTSAEARQALNGALPAADRPFKLDPKDTGLRHVLEDAIDRKQLPRAAEEHVRTLLDGKELTAEGVGELRAAINRPEQERRRLALDGLNELSRDNLHLTYEFEPIVKTLESLNTLQNTNQSVNDAIAVLSNGESTPEARQEALRKVNEHLSEIKRQLDTTVHGTTRDAVLDFNRNVPQGLDATIQALQSGDNEKALEALGLLRDNLSDGRDEQNQFRALRIVKDLGPNASPEDYRRALGKLNEEVQNSTLEEGKPNRHAVDWQNWGVTQEAVTNLSRSADAGNPVDARLAVDRLVREAEADNPYARTALAALLVGNQEGAQIGDWLRNHPEMNGDKPVYVPDLRNMPEALRLELMNRAADTMLKLSQEGKLTTEETSATALAFAQMSERGDQAQLATKFRQILENGVEGDSKTAVLSGIFEAMSSTTKGTETLAEIYLKGADDAVIAEHYPQIEKLAQEHHPGALRILAGIAGGMADGNDALNPKQVTALRDGSTQSSERDPIAERARKVLEEVGSRPGVRDSVVESMLHIAELGKTDARFADKNQLLATLGTVARDSQSAELIDRTAIALREGYAGSVESPDSKAHESSVDGMFAMARHWQGADARLITSRMSEQVARGFQRTANDIPADTRAQILETLSGNITGGKEIDFKTRLHSMHAFGAFGQHLNESQVRMLATFGGDGQYNLAVENVDATLTKLGITGETATKIRQAVANHENLDQVLKDNKIEGEQALEIKKAVADTRDGLQVLADLGIEGEDAKRFQAATAEALLTVLATAPNAPDGQKGPREWAYDAFKKLPWPMAAGDPLRDGGFKLIESRDSAKLRDALVNYFEGKPYDLELSQQINRIVDNAKLPRPAAAILHNLGVQGSDHLTKQPGDPPTVFEIADRIKEQYATATESGDQVLRNVTENISLVNSMPAADRARLMGWDKLSDVQKQALGWVSEPSAEEKARLQWDKMSEADRENFRWANARVDAQQVIGQMYNGLLNESSNKALLRDLNSEVAQMATDRARSVESVVNTINELKQQKRENLNEFVRKTEQGANFGRQLAGFFTGDNGRDAQLNEEQSRLARSFGELSRQIEEQQNVRAGFDQSRAGLELSSEAREYQRLLDSGDQTGADRLAMKMWKDHGPMLAQLAPGIWKDLTVSQDNTLQGESLMRRMHTRGQAHWDVIPGYTSGDAGPGQPYNHARALKGFEEALGLRPAYSTQHLDSPEARGLMQLGNDTSKLDTEALRAHMLGRLDSDRALKTFSDASRDMNEHLSELSKMFSAAMKGSVYEESIAVMKEKAEIIKSTMDKITAEDLQNLSTRIDSMEKALKEMQAHPDQHDPKTMEELQQRIDTYKGMHNLFNRFGNPKYPEVMDPSVDESGQPINQNKQISDMLNRVLDGGLSASTFTNWVKENGVLIGVTIAACAATVAACATFGVASPAAVGLWVAVAGLAAREVTNEVLYQVNKDGYTGWGNYDNKGSRAGQWGRQLESGEFEGFTDAMKHLGTDVLGPYAFEIARDWVAFVATAGLMNRMFGGMGSQEAAMSIFRSAPANARQLAYQSERAILAAEGKSVSANFMKQFLNEFGRELMINSGFGGLHMTAEAGVHAAIGRENMHKMGEWGQFGLSFALSTSLAIGQGTLHSAVWKPGNKLSFKLSEGVTESQFIREMQTRGFDVRQTRPGNWEVLPVGAKPGMVPITMENAERGAGRPPQDVAPEGVTPAKREVGQLEESVDAHGQKWQQTPAGKEALQHLAQATEHFMKGDYDKALELLNDTSTLPEKTSMEGVPREFDLAAFNAAAPADRARLLQDFMEESMSGVGRVRQEGDRTIGEYPKVEVTVDGARFDLATGRPVGQAQVTEAQQRAFDQFRNSPEGKRLMAEQALTAMEEKLHLLQEANGNRALSPSYVKFLRDQADPTAEQQGAIAGDGTKRSRDTLEQEAILALYDSGWSVEMLKHHFGNHHAETRAQVFKWLEGTEAVRRIPDQATRAQVENLLSSSPPGARDALLEHMPTLVKNNTPEALPKVVEALAQVRDAAGGQDLAAISSKLKELAARGDLPKDFMKDPVVAEFLARAMAENKELSKASGTQKESFFKDLKELGLSNDQIARLESALTPSMPPPTAQEIADAQKYITGKESKIKTQLSRPQQEAAGRAVQKLQDMVKDGKVHPETAKDIVDMMNLIAREGKVLSPESIEALSRLPKDLLMNHLSGAQLARLADALNLKAIGGDELVQAMARPEEFGARLTSMKPALDLMAGSKGQRTLEQAEQFLKLSAKEQDALRNLFNSDRISRDGFEALMKRMEGKSSGNEVLDSMLTPDTVTRLASGSSNEVAQLREAMVLASKYMDGSLTHPPDVIKKVLELDPASASDFAAVAGLKQVNTDHLNKIHADLIAIKDPKSQAIRANDHLALAMRDMNLQSQVLGIENPTLRGELTRAAAMKHVDGEQIARIQKAHQSSPDMAAAIDKIMADQSPTKNRTALVDSLIRKELNASEIGNLRKALDSGTLKPDQVEQLLGTGTQHFKSALDLAASGKLNDGDLIVSIANDNDAVAINKAIKEGLLDAEGAANILKMEGDHAEHVSTVLKAYEKGKMEPKPGDLNELIASPQKAFERILDLPAEFHANPDVVRVQKEALDTIKQMKNLNDEALEALNDFVRDEIPQLRKTSKAELDVRMRQLQWVKDQIAGMPADRASNLAEMFANSRLLTSAHMAGVRDHIPDGELVVFAHGTTKTFARDTIEQQGGTLTDASGAHGGKFFATVQIHTAREFAQRICNDPSRARAGEEPALVGVAIPRDVVAMLEKQKLLRSKEIDDRPGQHEWIFEPGAIKYLREHGYWFTAD